MRNSNLIKAIFLLLGLSFMGLECASTNITSAKLYIQQKNYDKAIDVLQKEVQTNPKSDEAYYYLGYVYGEKEMFDKMNDAYNKSLSISKKYDKEINDSKKYYWAQLFNKGVKYYQAANEAVKTNKDSSKVLYDKSINSFKLAVQLEPDSADTYKNLAFVYMSNGDNDNAIEPLKTLIDKQNSLDGYKFLGEIYYAKGQNLGSKFESSHNAQDSIKAMDYYNQVITLLEKGRKFYPDNSDLLLTLSNAYISAHKIDVAINAFKEGVEKDPNNKFYRYNYGVLLLGKKDYQGAILQFEKAIDIDPEYENALYNIAVAYVKWGADLAKESNDKEDTTIAYKPKFQSALPYLEKLVQIREDDAQTWELLGKVYTVLNMKDDAENAFSKADKIRKGSQ